MATFRKEDFGSNQLAAPTSGYVGEELGVIQGASTALEQAYQRNLGQYNKTKLAVDSVKRLPQDNELIQGRIQGLETSLDDIKASGDFELMGLKVNEVATSFAGDQAIQKAQQNYAKRQEVIDTITKDPNYRNEEERLSAIALADQRYSGVRRVDPATGLDTDDTSGIIVGDYQGYTPGKRVDVPSKIDSIADGYKADRLANSGVQFDGQGRIITQSLSTAGVSEQQIYNDLQNSFANDIEVTSSLEQDFELSNIRSNPQYYENGRLNAEGLQAQDEYVTNQIETFANQAAEKYGFTERASSVKLQADAAGLRAKQQKLEANITTSYDRTTVVADDKYDATAHRGFIRDTNKVIKGLEKQQKTAIAGNTGEWTVDKADELRRLKQTRDNHEFRFSLFKNATLKTDEGKAFKDKFLKRFNLKEDSNEAEEFLKGNPEPLARMISNGREGFDDIEDKTGLRREAAIASAEAISYYQQEYERVVSDVVKANDVAFDANTISVRDKAGKDIASTILTDNVSINPSAYLIDDGTGREVPLDQFQVENGLHEGYDMNTKLLADRIGGRDGYLITYTPKGKKANERETVSRVIYPGKGTALVEKQNNENLAVAALEAGGLRVGDDRSAVDFTLDIDRQNVSSTVKNLYKKVQAKEAERRFANGFTKLTNMYNDQGFISPGDHDVTFTGSDGAVNKATVKAEASPEGFTTLRVVSTINGGPITRAKNMTSLKDVYVDMLKEVERNAKKKTNG